MLVFQLIVRICQGQSITDIISSITVVNQKNLKNNAINCVKTNSKQINPIAQISKRAGQGKVGIMIG